MKSIYVSRSGNALPGLFLYADGAVVIDIDVTSMV